MATHGDRPRAPEWKPGSSMIPASSSDIAHQIKHPLTKATDGAAQAIRGRLQDHQDILQSAQNAFDRQTAQDSPDHTQPTVKRGRIIGPTDTALEASTPIVSSSDGIIHYAIGVIPDSPFRRVRRENATDIHLMGYDEQGVLEQRTVRMRNRPAEEGKKDIIVIRDKQDGSSFVTKYQESLHPEGINPDLPYIATTRDREGNVSATYFTNEGSPNYYHRDPHGNEIII